MCRWTSKAYVLLAVFGALVWSDPACGDDRPAKEILAEIDEFPIPRLEKSARKDKKAVSEFLARVQVAEQRRGPLVRELWRVDPDHDRLAGLLGETWDYEIRNAVDTRNEALVKLIRAGTDKERIFEQANLRWFGGIGDEIDAVIATSRNEKLRIDGVYWKAFLAMESHLQPLDALPAVEAFLRAAPKDDRGAGLLYDIARRSRDPEEQASLLTRVLADYPTSHVIASAERLLATLAGVGKPFELDFNDAITGRRVSMKELRGKAVVVEFWATWCGPCVDEMPKMKALYEKYRDQGVEFIGISLDLPKDQGGLDKLKAFVAENQIGWPQYYVNDSPKGGSSVTRGINGVPTLFLVDREGKLFSVHARGKLETMLPELLKTSQAKGERK